MIQTALSMTQIILGGIVLLLILGLIAVSVLAWADHIFQKHFQKGKQAQWEIDKNRLQDNAGWFGEDKATHKLILDLANGRDVNHARETWRNARKAAPQHPERMEGGV